MVCQFGIKNDLFQGVIRDSTRSAKEKYMENTLFNNSMISIFEWFNWFLYVVMADKEFQNLSMLNFAITCNISYWFLFPFSPLNQT